jgi:hypothetical protein
MFATVWGERLRSHLLYLHITTGRYPTGYRYSAEAGCGAGWWHEWGDGWWRGCPPERQDEVPFAAGFGTGCFTSTGQAYYSRVHVAWGA